MDTGGQAGRSDRLGQDDDRVDVDSHLDLLRQGRGGDDRGRREVGRGEPSHEVAPHRHRGVVEDRPGRPDLVGRGPGQRGGKRKGQHGPRPVQRDRGAPDGAERTRDLHQAAEAAEETRRGDIQRLGESEDDGRRQAEPGRAVRGAHADDPWRNVVESQVAGIRQGRSRREGRACECPALPWRRRAHAHLGDGEREIRDLEPPVGPRDRRCHEAPALDRWLEDEDLRPLGGEGLIRRRQENSAAKKAPGFHDDGDVGDLPFRREVGGRGRTGGTGPILSRRRGDSEASPDVQDHGIPGRVEADRRPRGEPIAIGPAGIDPGRPVNGEERTRLRGVGFSDVDAECPEGSVPKIDPLRLAGRQLPIDLRQMERRHALRSVQREAPGDDVLEVVGRRERHLVGEAGESELHPDLGSDGVHRKSGAVRPEHASQDPSRGRGVEIDLDGLPFRGQSTSTSRRESRSDLGRVDRDCSRADAIRPIGPVLPRRHDEDRPGSARIGSRGDPERGPRNRRATVEGPERPEDRADGPKRDVDLAAFAVRNREGGRGTVPAGPRVHGGKRMDEPRSGRNALDPERAVRSCRRGTEGITAEPASPCREDDVDPGDAGTVGRASNGAGDASERAEGDDSLDPEALADAEQRRPAGPQVHLRGDRDGSGGHVLERRGASRVRRGGELPPGTRRLLDDDLGPADWGSPGGNIVLDRRRHGSDRDHAKRQPGARGGRGDAPIRLGEPGDPADRTVESRADLLGEGNEREDEIAVRARHRPKRVLPADVERDRMSAERSAGGIVEVPVDRPEVPVEDDVDRPPAGIPDDGSEIDALVAIEGILGGDDQASAVRGLE